MILRIKKVLLCRCLNRIARMNAICCPYQYLEHEQRDKMPFAVYMWNDNELHVLSTYSNSIARAMRSGFDLHRLLRQVSLGEIEGD